MFGAPSVAKNPNPNQFEIQHPPNDSISSIAWSPVQNLLIATAWDNEVRCWEVNTQGGSQPKFAYKHDQPPLCSAWKNDGQAIFTAGCDKQVKMCMLASPQQQQVVAAHDQPIKSIAWIPEAGSGLLATGSWDRSIRYWDLRQQTPALTVALPERLYTMDVRHPLMVVGTADRNILVYNLANPQTVYKTIQSPLKYQTRCVAAFPDKSGFLVGSIEGRVAVHHVEDANQGKNFTFKCHRVEKTGQATEIYPINSMHFHPVHGTFSTVGSDGGCNFWDKDSKQRLKQFVACPQAIPAAAFNGSGEIFAYAMSYDWCKGAEYYNPQVKPAIYLHAVAEKDCKKRDNATTTRAR